MHTLDTTGAQNLTRWPSATRCQRHQEARDSRGAPVCARSRSLFQQSQKGVSECQCEAVIKDVSPKRGRVLDELRRLPNPGLLGRVLGSLSMA